MKRIFFLLSLILISLSATAQFWPAKGLEFSGTPSDTTTVTKNRLFVNTTSGKLRFIINGNKYSVPTGFSLTDGDKGDLTVSGSGNTWTIDAAAVSFSKIQNVNTSSFLGRVTGGSGSIENLTGTQATSLLDAFTAGAKGLVPASGGGTVNFLRADGSFAPPTGSPGGASNELQKNSGSSTFTGTKLFSSADGNFTLGDNTLAGSDRTITASGSAGSVGFAFNPKGNGNFTINGTTQLLVDGSGTTLSNGSIILNNGLGITSEQASTNSVLYPLSISRQTTGTPAAGIGTGIRFNAETASSATFNAANIKAVSEFVSPAGTEMFGFVIETTENGGLVESFRVLQGTARIKDNGGKFVDLSNGGLVVTAGVGAGPAQFNFISSDGVPSAASTAGDGQTINIIAGDAGAASGRDGGNITVQAGNADGAGTNGKVIFETALYGSAGTGDVTTGVGLTVNGNETVNGSTTLRAAAVDNEILRITSTATGTDPNVAISQNRVETTDATVTTLHPYVTSTGGYYLTGSVIARKTSGGVGEELAAYEFKGLYVNNGSATLIGSATVTTIAESVAGWDVTLTTSGNNVLVRVTGAASRTITWHCVECKASQITN